jgi:hypothetical protein
MAGQPAQRTPEQDVPFLERLKRLLPGFLSGRQTSDAHLPMEAFTERDPRLPAPTGFDAIRGGLEQVHDLGGTMVTPQEQTALDAIQRMARGMRKP